MTKSRIACIYWPTSSVGGVATHCEHMKTFARRSGFKFDVLVSGAHKTKSAGLYLKPERIRGGDTYIVVDGQASHHPDQIDRTQAWLKENYDILYFCYLCPHPTKAYGDEPLFLPLMDLDLPRIARISDAYWESYAEWGRMALDRVQKCLVVNDAYAEPLLKLGLPITKSVQPFWPTCPLGYYSRDEKPSLVWANQWKAIKGIKKFIKVLPDIHIPVRLYSCGIEYYQLRWEDIWEEAIGTDHFKSEHSGKGRAEYFVEVPYSKVAEIMSRGWFHLNFQGHAAKYEAYKKGGYNNTEVEALYYGALPILHDSIKQSALPQDCYVTAKKMEEVPLIVQSEEMQRFAADPVRQQKAAAWVLENHSVQKVFNDTFGEILNGNCG